MRCLIKVANFFEENWDKVQIICKHVKNRYGMINKWVVMKLMFQKLYKFDRNSAKCYNTGSRKIKKNQKILKKNHEN